MTATVEAAGGHRLTPLRAAVDEQLASDLSLLSQHELLDVLRGMELESRRLAAVQHRPGAAVGAPAGRRGLRPPAPRRPHPRRAAPRRGPGASPGNTRAGLR